MKLNNSNQQLTSQRVHQNNPNFVPNHDQKHYQPYTHNNVNSNLNSPKQYVHEGVDEGHEEEYNALKIPAGNQIIFIFLLFLTIVLYFMYL